MLNRVNEFSLWDDWQCNAMVILIGSPNQNNQLACIKVNISFIFENNQAACINVNISCIIENNQLACINANISCIIDQNLIPDTHTPPSTRDFLPPIKHVFANVEWAAEIIVNFSGEPGVAAASPEAAELRRGSSGARGAWTTSPRLGDGQDSLRPALLHEPHHQDNPVGRSEKGESEILVWSEKNHPSSGGSKNRANAQCKILIGDNHRGPIIISGKH